MEVAGWQLYLAVIAGLLWRTEGLTCLSCSDVAIPRDCGAVVHCGHTEVCYLDSYVTATGNIRYTSGCRDIQACTSVSGRRSAENHMAESRSNQGDTKSCSDCCNTDTCNSGGCGTTGFVPKPNRGPICYVCPQHIGVGTCNRVQVCGRGEVCKVKLTSRIGTGDIYYESSCQAQQLCEQDLTLYAVFIGRRRYAQEIVTASKTCTIKCCDDDLCNHQCGSTNHGGVLQPGTTALPNACLSNPCVQGTCSQYQNTYQCACHSGATGRNCDTVTDPCISNPCVYGQCHGHGISYTCSCRQGYTGTNCDTVSNPCVMSPCVHGQCHSHGSTYTCTCVQGYTGTNCDHVYNPSVTIPCVHGQYHTYSHPPGSLVHGVHGPYTCTCVQGYMGANCDQAVSHGGSGSSTCPSGWQQYGHSCYWIHKDETATWSRAKEICRGHSAYLAEINDSDENDWLIRASSDSHQGDWFLGGTDSQREGHWRWDHSGHSITHMHHVHWCHGSPNGKSAGDCLEIHKVGRCWNDESCGHTNHFICEKNI